MSIQQNGKELFVQLESNKKEVVEAAKQKILDLFSTVKDQWLLNGFYDYYLSKNSANTIAVLVNVKEPHHDYLFERLSESIHKSSKIDVKVQALTLLGHVVRSQPTWLYKLPKHHLLKDVLKLLKDETELLPLISALLVLIVLIPMIPYSMGEQLQDIFQIFSRLASWNCTSGKVIEDQMIHLQVALYALFLRLYGMFPCNFLSYLRAQYKDKNGPVFIHTIKPMLETVKMNPSLVTTSQDNEKTCERWRNMEVHDVIVECEKYSLDVSDTYCAHDSCQLASGFRSRSGTANSTIESSYFQSLKTLAASMSNNEKGEYFSPSMVFNRTSSMNSGSAPSTAPIAYIPQTEFTHDENIVPQAGSSPPETAEEATPETTPMVQEGTQYASVRSQPQYMGVTKAFTSFNLSPTHPPSSPLRKEPSPFTFQISATTSPAEEMKTFLDKTPTKGGSHLTRGQSIMPESPLKVKSEADMGKHSPIKSMGSVAAADEEVLRIEQRDQASHMPALKQSDSVLHESEDSASEHMEEDRSSPCTAGGLHMPNSKSMKDFAKRVQRLRHHSQCSTTEPDPEIPELMTTSGSSPEMGDGSGKVRRANSCPEMKKSPANSIKDSLNRTLDETDEETNVDVDVAISNGMDHRVSIDTQTDNFWPMPYEHLFLGIFPTLGTSDKTGSGPSSGSGSGNSSQERYTQPSIYEVLDKYIDTAVHCSDKDAEIKHLKDQLEFLHQHLLFERHRREIHAFKNRRYLADAKSTQVLEEHNSALRDQVQLQQTDIDSLQSQLDKLQARKEKETHRTSDTILRLEEQCKSFELRYKTLQEKEADLRKDVEEYKSKCSALTTEKQKAESSVVDALQEANFAKEQARTGEKGRAELENVNKQMLLIGELQLKYQERLDELSSLRRSDQELEMVKAAFNQEIKGLEARLQTKTIKLEAANAKIQNLEQTIHQNDDTITTLKRDLKASVDECEEKVRAVEQKYQTQLVICRQYEEKILEMYRNIEMANKTHRSPDTSSCQEVQVSSSDRASGGAQGVSEKSSPLSCLSSSEGSSAQAQADLREVRGLQAFIDDESPRERRPGAFKDFEERPSTSSPKHD